MVFSTIRTRRSLIVLNVRLDRGLTTMTEPEENEDADNSRRDSSSAMSPKSSRFKELLDQIPEDIDETPRDLSTDSDTSRFDNLLDQINEDKSNQSNERRANE